MRNGPFKEGEEPVTDVIVKLLCRLTEAILSESGSTCVEIEEEVNRLKLKDAYRSVYEYLLSPDDASNILGEEDMENGKSVQMLLGIIAGDWREYYDATNSSYLRETE